MITKPTLILDEEKCKRNIAKMVSKAAKNNLILRPHFKTHQSLEIGHWFKNAGVNCITVSSITMAQYFAKEWNNITVAFPINILEIEEINDLASKVTLNLIAVNKESISFLNQHLRHPVNIFIKIDVGTHRTGVLPDNYNLIDSITTEISASSFLHFKGFLGHAGHSYQCRGIEEIQKVHNEAKSIMKTLKTRYESGYPQLQISLGDTPTCSVAEGFEKVDEIRPGNFVFYDITQEQIGSNSYNEIAVAMACPIVAIHPERNEVVVYGGGIHLSKDVMIENDTKVYGKIALADQNGWGDILEDCFVKKLSQEHGIIKVSERLISQFKIGEFIYILPVHSCMSADLMKSYLTTDGCKISMLNSNL